MSKQLNQSLATFTQNLTAALESVVAQVESFDYSQTGATLTVKSMVEDLASTSGLPMQLLQLAASQVIGSSDTHHIVQGRHGGVKAGQRKEKVAKEPSKKALALAENEALKARIAELEAEKVSSEVSEEDVNVLDALSE